MLNRSKASARRQEFTASATQPLLVEAESGLAVARWYENPLWQWVLVVLLTLVGFFMRRNNLGTQSLWFDEADLVSRASSSLDTILQNFFKAGENGPLYTLFMHFWIQFFGSTELVVRMPSLVAGTAAIPLIFLVARKLGGLWVGLLAALLLAVSPYNIWYSQDAKMYPLALAFSLASVWLFLKAFEDGRWRWWLPYVVISTLGIYIHLLTILIVLVEIAYYFSLRLLKTPATSQDLPARRRTYISLALLTLPYLPIAIWQLIAIRDGTLGETWFNQVGLWDIFNSLIRHFAVNRSIEPWESLGAYAFLAAALFGLVVVWRLKAEKSGRPALFLTLYLFLPIIAFYLLTIRIPLFADRYLLVAAPAYYILIACGLVWLAKKRVTLAVAGAVLVALLGSNVVALASVNYSKESQKEDWKLAMQKLSEQVRTGDVVLVVPGYLETAVDYYFKPKIDVPVVTLPQSIVRPKAIGDADDIAMNDAMQKILRGHERLWLVTSPERYQKEDPQEFVRRTWLDNNTQMFTDPQEFVGVKFYGYSFYLIPGTKEEFYPRTAQTNYVFGDTLRLEGYDVSPAAGLATGTVKQLENLHLTLYLRKIKQDKGDYEIKVRLVDKDGKDTSTNYIARPTNGYHPTKQWNTNEPVRDYREVYIKVPPGEYRLEISVQPAGKPDAPLTVSGNEKTTSVQNASKILLALPIKVIP